MRLMIPKIKMTLKLQPYNITGTTAGKATGGGTEWWWTLAGECQSSSFAHVLLAHERTSSTLLLALLP
jgi:hypothetical protein